MDDPPVIESRVIEPAVVPTTPWWRDRRYLVLVALGVAAGIALRIWIMRSPINAFDSDEAVVALMGRHIVTRHEFTVFFWGQAYGGSLEAIISAPFFWLFGASVATLRAMLVAVSFLTPALVYLLGRRTVGAKPAIVAAALVWIWPANYVWISTETRGFYWACMVLGLTLLLVVLRLIDRPERVVEWLALGLVAGLGFWTSPQFLYFLVPGGIWLVASLRKEAGRVVYGVPAALAGSAPWIVFNVRHRLASFHAQSHHFDHGYVGNIKALIAHGIPVALGLNVLERWIVPAALYPVIVVTAALLLVRQRRRIDVRRVGLVVLVGATYPLIWGIFPVSGVIGEGRYVMFLQPVIALVLAVAATNFPGRAALMAGAVALSAVGTHRIAPEISSVALDVPVPTHTGGLIATLERLHVRRFYGNYWVTYRVTFETKERIIGAPTTDDRYARYQRIVAADPNPAYVFVQGTRVEAPFVEYLRGAGIGVRREQIDGFAIYLPDHAVRPAEIPGRLSGQ